MIHEIEPMQYHVEYHDLQPTAEDTVFLFDGNGLFHRLDQDEIVFPKFRDLEESVEAYAARAISFRYLFSIENERFFMPDIHNEDSVTVPEAFSLTTSNMFRITPQHLAFACVTAQQLRQWYSSRCFCGRCGTKIKHSDIERAMVCPECGLIEYPKLSPVVILGVTHGDSILVTRYKDRPGNYALIAGFCEIGESLEDAARREVYEETGVHIKEITYYKSQPWALSSSLISGFFCKLEGDPHIHMDEQELSEAIWLPREELPPLMNTFALTAEMMEMFRIGEIR